MITPRLAFLCALAFPLGVAAQGALPKQSPFAPPAGTAPAPVADETLEFAGVSSVGKKTDVIIHDKAAKRKHWIALGDTVEGITVVRYDSGRDVAVVRVNGTEKVLALRKPTRNTAAQPAPAPVVHTGFNIPSPISPPPMVNPAPMVQKIQPPPPPGGDVAAAQPQPQQAPAAPATPEAQAKAETEARMLVSDLLEIGMAQRRAYEEAQRKAAGGGAETQPNPAGAQPEVPGAAPPPATPQPPPLPGPGGN